MLKFQGSQLQGLNAEAIASLKQTMADAADKNGNVVVVEISSKEVRRINASTNVDFSRFLPIGTYRELTGYQGAFN